MRADHQILHHEARVAFEAGAARWCGDLDGPFLVDRKLRARAAPPRRCSPELPGGFGSVACSMPLGLMFGRPGPPFSRAISSRSAATIRCSSTICFPLLHNQALQLGVRQTVKILGRRHSQNESDSRPPGNRKIIPPRVLPLLHNRYSRTGDG